jgi:competence protein ComEA
MKKLLLLLFSASLIFGAAIDINKASVKELSSLKGIGEKKAKAIVSYRKKECFKSVKDLTKVKGIGPKFLEKNKGKIKASGCKKKSSKKTKAKKSKKTSTKKTTKK